MSDAFSFMLDFVDGIGGFRFAGTDVFLLPDGINPNPNFKTSLRRLLEDTIDADSCLGRFHGNKERFKQEIIPRLKLKWSNYNSQTSGQLDSMDDLVELIRQMRQMRIAGPLDIWIIAYHPDLPSLGAVPNLDTFILPPPNTTTTVEAAAASRSMTSTTTTTTTESSSSSSSSSSSPTTTTTTTQKECIICFENFKNHVFIPCRHKCLCRKFFSCGFKGGDCNTNEKITMSWNYQLKSQKLKMKCPICRQKFQHVYL